MNDLDIATAGVEDVKDCMRAWPVQKNGKRDYRLVIKLLERIKALRPDLFRAVAAEWAREQVYIAPVRMYTGLKKLGVIFKDGINGRQVVVGSKV